MTTKPSTLPSFDALVRSCRSENLLGQGGHTRVYRVDGCSDFVVKEYPAPSDPRTHVDLTTTPVRIEDPVLASRNFGQPVARYHASLLLLRHQSGTACGVPLHDRVTVKDQHLLSHIYEESTRRASAQSIKAFEQLVDDWDYVNRAGYNIDPSKADNLLLDTHKGRFGIVDLIQKTSRTSSPDELLVMLFDNSFSHRYAGTNMERLIEHRREIIDKLISACEIQNIALTHQPKSSSSVAYALKLAGYEEGSMERALIEARMRCTGPRLGDRVMAEGIGNQQPALRCV